MNTRRILAAAALCVLAAEAAGEFHFTVTADMRSYHSSFDAVAQSINNDVGGPGAFHVSPGDIDGTIADNRAVIDARFGPSAVWYPLVGNHETETAADMTWVRDEYNSGNGARTPLKTYTNQDGPAGAVETTFSWDYGNAHFISLNEYYNGVSDVGTDGDVVPALYDWLAADLAANQRPFVFVFGHEPAYPENRHVGDSLDKYPARRDAFWALLEAQGVQAYFCGHTHYYSKHRNAGGTVWQFDAGNAGNGAIDDGLTYLDVVVGPTEARVNVYRDKPTGTFALADSVTVLGLVVPGDANGDGAVDVGDLGILGAHYGQSGVTWAEGDFTAEGNVDVGDLGVLGAHYGAGAGGSPVPEPASVLVLAVLATAVGRSRRRAPRG